MNTIEVMKQAREALEVNSKFHGKSPQCDKAITNLRTAIAELEKVEPFCYMSETYEVGLFASPPDDGDFEDMFPVYRHPAPAVPDGWQLVPKKITQRQIDALIMKRFGMSDIGGIYDDLLAAAPKPEDVK